MTPRGRVRRRGQPLIALGLIMVSWVGARAALWNNVVIAPSNASTVPLGKQPAPAVLSQHRTPAAPALARPGEPVSPAPARIAPPVLTAPPAPLASPTTQAPPLVADTPLATVHPMDADAPLSPQVAAGHQQLWLAGMELLPTEPVTTALDQSGAQRPLVPLAARAADRAAGPRWSVDGWLLVRPGGNMFNAPGAGLPGAVIPAGFYGGSQGGLILRYFLAPGSRFRPALYLRASSGVERPRGEELAAGVSFRPVPGLPVRLLAEGRVTRAAGGTIIRPAAALVSELPPARLPLGARAEVYVQAGYVGGRESTAFVDGQARVEKPLLHATSFELRAGGGVWGGAQRGASRLDVGPTATVSFHLGPVGTRLSADYRWRVAGNAAPGSGPVVTLSAGF